MEIVVFEDFFFDILESLTCIEEYSLRHDDTRTPPDFYHLGNMLEEEHLRGIRLKYKVLLNIIFLFSAKWRIRKDDIISILVLYISDIRRESIDFADIRIMYPVEYHIHHTKDICEGCFLISEKCVLSEKIEFFIGLYLWTNMMECFDEESTASCRRVINRLSHLRIHDIDDELDDRSWSIELSTISPIISHSLEEVFIDFREFEYIFLTLEIHPIDDIENLPECMTTLDTIIEEEKYLTDFVFDRVIVGINIPKSLQIWK